MIISLIVAATLGFIVGIERNLYERSGDQNVRLSHAWRRVVYGYHLTQTFDPSRIIAQIVTGIGFIGAGSLFSIKIKYMDLRLRQGCGRWRGGVAAGMRYYTLAVAARLLVLLFFLRCGSLRSNRIHAFVGIKDEE